MVNNADRIASLEESYAGIVDRIDTCRVDADTISRLEEANRAMGTRMEQLEARIMERLDDLAGRTRQAAETLIPAAGLGAAPPSPRGRINPEAQAMMGGRIDGNGGSGAGFQRFDALAVGLRQPGDMSLPAACRRAAPSSHRGHSNPGIAATMMGGWIDGPGSFSEEDPKEKAKSEIISCSKVDLACWMMDRPLAAVVHKENVHVGGRVFYNLLSMESNGGNQSAAFQKHNESGQLRERPEIAPDQREKYLQRIQQVQQLGHNVLLHVPHLNTNTKQLAMPQQSSLLRQSSSLSSPAGVSINVQGLLVYRLVIISAGERILQRAKKKLMLNQLFVNKPGSQKEVEYIRRWVIEEFFSDSGGENYLDIKNGWNYNVDATAYGENKHRRKTCGLEKGEFDDTEEVWICGLLVAILLQEECTLLLPLRIMVMEDMIYMLHVEGLAELSTLCLQQQLHFVDLEVDPPQLLLQTNQTFLMSEFTSIQKLFSSLSQVDPVMHAILKEMPPSMNSRIDLPEYNTNVASIVNFAASQTCEILEPTNFLKAMQSLATNQIIHSLSVLWKSNEINEKYFAAQAISSLVCTNGEAIRLAMASAGCVGGLISLTSHVESEISITDLLGILFNNNDVLQHEVVLSLMNQLIAVLMLGLGKDRPHCKLERVKVGIVDNALKMLHNTPGTLCPLITELLCILTNNNGTARSSFAARMVEPLFSVLHRTDITVWGQHSTLQAFVNILEKPQSLAALKSTQRLPRLVGLTKALEIILMFKSIKGEAAHSFGLIDSIVPPDQLVVAARRWGHWILSSLEDHG